MELAEAFARCRAIARQQAKNFYFAFVALPRAKSDAMCAMYAFMRRADDIADEETQSIAERRELMRQWLEAFRSDEAFDANDRLVFAAVRETQRRYGIADALLEELVAGTTMDLAEVLPAGVRRLQLAGRTLDCYETLAALDRYCYLVASVVGLVTIRIFGCTDPRADELAAAMGKAFQYTNILRDVREDAERGRVYLPLDLLAGHGATVDDVVRGVEGQGVAAGLDAALRTLGTLAEEFYSARAELVPLLARDSRPAMRVLIRIYHALLVKMRRRGYRVFEGRVRVSTGYKLLILARGLLGSAFSRLT